MEQNRLQILKTRFLVLMGIAGIILVLLIISIFSIFNINEELLNNASGLLIILFLVLLVVLFLLVAFNLFNILKYSKILLSENQKLNESVLGVKKETEEAKTDEQEVEEEKSFLDEIWEIAKKEKEIDKKTESLLINLSKKVELVQGLFYLFNKKDKKFKIASKYAYYNEEDPAEFELGEGLSGQVAKDMKPMLLTEMPEKYMTIISGLGNGVPSNLLIIPVINKKKVIGIIEIATFKKIDFDINKFVEFFEKISDEFLTEKKK